MKKKYILTQSKITNRLVRSINNLLMENDDLSLIPIKVISDNNSIACLNDLPISLLTSKK